MTPVGTPRSRHVRLEYAAEANSPTRSDDEAVSRSVMAPLMPKQPPPEPRRRPTTPRRRSTTPPRYRSRSATPIGLHYDPAYGPIWDSSEWGNRSTPPMQPQHAGSSGQQPQFGRQAPVAEPAGNALAPQRGRSPGISAVSTSKPLRRTYSVAGSDGYHGRHNCQAVTCKRSYSVFRR